MQINAGGTAGIFKITRPGNILRIPGAYFLLGIKTGGKYYVQNSIL